MSFVATMNVAQMSDRANQLREDSVQSFGGLMPSFSRTLEQVIDWMPRLLAALLVLVLGYIVARLLAKAITALSEKLGLQRAAEQGGLVESTGGYCATFANGDPIRRLSSMSSEARPDC